MNTFILHGFQDELLKIAEEQRPSRVKRLAKGLAIGGTLLGTGAALHHFAPIALKKGTDYVKKHVSEAVEDGIKKGTQGMAWRAFGKKAGVMDDMQAEYSELLAQHASNPSVMSKLHPVEALSAHMLKNPSMGGMARKATQTMFPAVARR